jgi:hypothetical protein
MLYGAECWPTKRRHAQQLSVAEMRMLRWICSNTRRDRVRNDDIHERLGVTPVVVVMSGTISMEDNSRKGTNETTTVLS